MITLLVTEEELAVIHGALVEQSNRLLEEKKDTSKRGSLQRIIERQFQRNTSTLTYVETIISENF